MNGKKKLTEGEKEQMLNERLRQEAIERSKQNAERYKPYRIFIGIPSGDMVHADFAMSLAAMVNHCTSVHIRILLNNTKGAEICHSRNKMVAEAEQQKATHILFIDSDMAIAPITVQRMLDVMIDTKDNKENDSLPPVKVLGCTVPMRKYPYVQVAKDLEGKRLKIEMNNEKGVVEIKEIGTGLLMIDMECFKEFKQPYFAPYYREKDGRCDLMGRVSEDLSLIEKFRDKGIKIFCDLPLSQNTQHIGQVKFDYTSEDFFADAVELRKQKAQEQLKDHLEKQKEAKEAAGEMATESVSEESPEETSTDVSSTNNQQEQS